MRTKFLLVAALLLPAVPAAGAQDDRYVLEKSGEGFVRMDRQTGEMSTCRTEGTGLVCKLAADERTAYQQEIDSLQEKVDGLEERVAKLENSLASRLESTLPTEQDFEKTLGYMERFFRSIMGIVRDMEKEEPAAPQGTPQKT